MNFRDWRRLLKIWAPPLIGIILLINPVAETFWPSQAQERRGRPVPQPSTQVRARREAQMLRAKQKPASETPTERLARLQRHKEALDQKIKKLTTQDKEHLK
ncbi:MAG: hypothetical protein ACRDH2_03155 [Anaerolineales bacterium]